MWVCDCNSFYFTKMLNGLIGLQGKWHWNPCCVHAGTAQAREHLQWELEPGSCGASALAAAVALQSLGRAGWQQLYAVRRSCVRGEKGEGGPKSPKGRMYSAAWYVLNAGASSCDCPKWAWCEWWSLNLLGGWEERLFPICASVCRRVWLEKRTCSLSLIAKYREI